LSCVLEVDLFDGKDLGVVVQCLHSLGSTLQAKHPAFGGPHLGVRTATANKRGFTSDQVRATRTQQRLPRVQQAAQGGAGGGQGA
jgi:hypothetical protein